MTSQMFEVGAQFKMFQKGSEKGNLDINRKFRNV